MKVKLFVYSLLMGLFFISSCKDGGNECKLNLDPKPKICEESEGEFRINTGTEIVVKEFTPRNMIHAETLHDKIREKTGHVLGIMEDYQGRSKNCIIIEESKLPNLGKYGYEVSITPNTIRLRAKEEHGYLYAIETLLHIMDNNYQYMTDNQNGYSKKLSLPCMYVMDNSDLSKRESIIHMNDSISVDSVYSHIINMKKHKLTKLILMDMGHYDVPKIVEIREYAKNHLIELDIVNHSNDTSSNRLEIVK